jgi:hypothetical protein
MDNTRLPKHALNYKLQGREEEIVDALGKDGNASMPEQFNQPNLWRMIMMMMKYIKNFTKSSETLFMR